MSSDRPPESLIPDSMISRRHRLERGDLAPEGYEIEGYLGSGTTGTVYLCSHSRFPGRQFAMKVLELTQAELEADPQLLRRFEREVRTSFLVDHPNVAISYAFIYEEDFVAYTMEYVDGGDLARLIDTKKKISISRAVKILCQACSAVQAIHDAGIVHRDLKPGNILLTKDGDVKVSDFGVARINDGQNMTADGSLLGTIDYFSPEYLEDGQIDQRSDVYTLGLLGYEMITGGSPFVGTTFVEALRSKLYSNPPIPHTIRNECPEELSKIILKALSRQPKMRYQRPVEMLNDLNIVEQTLGRESTIELERVVLVQALADAPLSRINNRLTELSDQQKSEIEKNTAAEPFSRLRRLQQIFAASIDKLLKLFSRIRRR